MTKTIIPVYHRWMIRRDMPEVLHIENAVFDFPWTEDDFVKALQDKSTIGRTAEVGDIVVGFLIYTLHRKCIEIRNLAVHPGWQRSKVGTQIIEHMKAKLDCHRRNRLVFVVHESMDSAHLFLRSVGFKAEKVIRDWGEENSGDGYKFVCRAKGMIE